MPRQRKVKQKTRTRPATRLADRMHSTAIRLLRWMREADRALPVPAAQLSALSVVVYRGPISLTELADAEHVRPPSMSRVVHELEEAGLVARRADRADRRVSRFRATAKGRRMLARGRAGRLRMLERALAGLSTTDRRALREGTAVLERLLRRARAGAR